MRTLILMRHAKSDWKQPGVSDHDRPLNRRGREAAPSMARQLLDQNIHVDVILASTAVRVQETLQLVRPTWGKAAEVFQEKGLYLASAQQIVNFVLGLHDDWSSAMVLGHNPGISQLLHHLGGVNEDMPTAAVAVLQCDADTWKCAGLKRTWQLLAFWKPRELPTVT